MGLGSWVGSCNTVAIGCDGVYEKFAMMATFVIHVISFVDLVWFGWVVGFAVVCGGLAAELWELGR